MVPAPALHSDEVLLRADRPVVVRHAIAAMGTRFEFVLAGEDEERLHVVAEAALAEVVDWHNRLSAFQHDSDISHINRNAAERATRVDGDVFALLLLCRGVWSASGGAFDITIGSLMRRSGFRGERSEPLESAEWGMDAVELDEGAVTVRFRRPGLSLDLGAVGKGWALDRAAAIVRECSVTCGLLHGGTSSVIAIGHPPDQPGWRVSLGAECSAPVACLRDTTLSVSAPRGRTIATESGSAGHIIDPRSGRPSIGAAMAAVVCPSAALGDAWSTALVVHGRRCDEVPGSLTTAIAPGDSDKWLIEGDFGGVFTRPFIPLPPNPM